MASRFALILLSVLFSACAVWQTQAQGNRICCVFVPVAPSARKVANTEEFKLFCERDFKVGPPGSEVLIGPAFPENTLNFTRANEVGNDGTGSQAGCFGQITDTNGALTALGLRLPPPASKANRLDATPNGRPCAGALSRFAQVLDSEGNFQVLCKAS